MERAHTDHLPEGLVSGILNERRDVYNPVYFYGDPCAAAELTDRLARAYALKFPGRKTVRVRGADFVRDMIRCMREDSLREFETRFCHADLLVMEDIEALAGNEFAMQVFYGLFDRIYEAGGQIVATGLHAPADIPALEDRVRTQLLGGVICRVG